MANASGTVSSVDTHFGNAEPRVLDNQVRVSTPENISFQYEVTGPSRRLLAYLADVVITLSVYFLISFLISLLFVLVAGWLAGTPLAPLFQLLGEIASGLLYAVAFLSLWFYGAYMETMYNGQTFGKKLCSIRAISTDGSAIDGTQATLRNFFRLIDVSPFISIGLIFGPEVGENPALSAPFIPIFAFGLISMVLSPRYQRIGDFVAGTIVVTEARKWAFSLAQFQDPRVASLAEILPESYVVTPSMAKSLAEYVDRRRVLPQQRSLEIASHLGQPLLRQFGLPADTSPDLLLCSLYFKTFINNNRDETKNGPLERQVASEPAVAAMASIASESDALSTPAVADAVDSSNVEAVPPNPDTPSEPQ